MARILQIDRGQYYNGLANYFRGDDWTIPAKVVESLPGAYNTDVDLTGWSATAYFPSDPATSLAAVTGTVTLSNAKAGEVTIAVPASLSASGQLTPQGSDVYIIAASGSLRATYATVDQAVAIHDRGFQTF